MGVDGTSASEALAGGRRRPVGSRARASGRATAVGSGWRASLRVAAAAFVITRVAVWLAGVVSVEVFGLSSAAPGFDPSRLTSGFGAVGDVLVAPAARWDATW